MKNAPPKVVGLDEFLERLVANNFELPELERVRRKYRCGKCGKRGCNQRTCSVEQLDLFVPPKVSKNRRH